jgi:hypothetical protein
MIFREDAVGELARYSDEQSCEKYAMRAALLTIDKGDIPRKRFGEATLIRP